jgi:hypothetical protein
MTLGLAVSLCFSASSSSLNSLLDYYFAHLRLMPFLVPHARPPTQAAYTESCSLQALPPVDTQMMTVSSLPAGAMPVLVLPFCALHNLHFPVSW